MSKLKRGLLLGGTSVVDHPTGQTVFEGRVEAIWDVPKHVKIFAAVAVGEGGQHAYGGGGGGLSWRNNISVKPRDVVRIVINNLHSVIYINDAVALLANAGSGYTGGTGGKVAHSINDGGGRGGNGSNSRYYQSSGGAGGYTGNGGNYGGQAGWSGGGSGGGGGGGHDGFGGVYGSDSTRWGGGVGIWGQGINGKAIGSSGHGYMGSPLSGRDTIGVNYGGGGGGTTSTWGKGAVRIIWGDGRLFPSTNTKDM